MNEFQNRMAAQRRILQLVNGAKPQTEELFGLSSAAIERWASANAIYRDSELLSLVKTASAKLFFLANKSQEQISEDYRSASREVADVTNAIAQELL